MQFISKLLLIICPKVDFHSKYKFYVFGTDFCFAYKFKVQCKNVIVKPVSNFHISIAHKKVIVNKFQHFFLVSLAKNLMISLNKMFAYEHTLKR